MSNLFIETMVKYLFSFALIVAATNSNATAAVREVPNGYATINAAIAAASAGDTIRVFAGTYTEHLNINKSLVMIGSGPDTATIVAAPNDFDTNSAYNYARTDFTTERTIVHIGSTAVINVVMKGFTVDGRRLGPSGAAVSYSGILAERTVVTITNNTIKNILPADSAQTYQTTYNGRGIHVRGDSSVAIISFNRLEQINRYHILVTATENTNNPPAVFPTATVNNDTIVGKGLYNGAQKGIWFERGAWGTISGNVVSNMDYPNSIIESDRATGITIRRGRLNANNRNLILNNYVDAGASHINNKGIFVEGKGDSVSDNVIIGFRYGLQIDDQDSLTAVRNTITGGEVGVMISTTTKTEDGNQPPLGIPTIAPYAITIGGSPTNKNTIIGQETFAIALSFRDAIADGTFMSTVPVDARYNDFGVYTENAIRSKIWDRADTTLISGNPVDTVNYYPFYVDKIRASVKVFLQGPYVAAGDSMSNALRTGGHLASHFGGTIPTLAVDSINLEIRNAASAAASTIRKFAPAWLMTDGTIRNFSDATKSYVEFDTTISGNYYIVVRHRNHLAIMDSLPQALDGSTTPNGYDFSTSQTKAYGTNPMIALGTRFGMVAGDANTSGTINAADRTATRLGANQTGYRLDDVTLDGATNAADRTRTRLNANRNSQVP